MKTGQDSFRNQLKQNKLLLRKLESADKNNKLKKGSLQHYRIMASVHNAGHVRGGHGYH